MRTNYLFMALALSLLPLAAASGSTVVANFDDGNSTAEVDAYVGMPGDGWDTAWKVPTPANQSVTAAAVTPGDAGFSEVTPGSGSYMSYEAVGTSSGAGSGAVTRAYDDPAFGIVLSQPHTVEFTVRLDEDVSLFDNYSDRYYLYDIDIARNGSYGGCRWIISAYGGAGSAAPADVVGEWSLYNGTRAGGWANTVNTDIAMVTGGVYDFKVDVDPATQSWDCTISDGTNTFTETGLGWRNAGPSSGGYLGFNARNATTGDTRAFSLDNISITQSGVLPPGGLYEVSAHFDGGNTDTVVDAFTGMAGDGWGGGWTRVATVDDPLITGESKVIMPGDTGFAELAPGAGAYLSNTLSIDSTSTGRVQQSVTRDYVGGRPGIDFTKEHTISFLVRIDEDIDGALSTFDHFEDRYYLFDTVSKTAGPGSTTSWLISAFGASGSYAGEEIVGEWSFYDGDNDGVLSGDNNVDTDMALVAGGVYEFTITIDPDAKTYDATVSDGTDSFTAPDLGWRTSANYVGGNITFANWGYGGGDDRAFSLDSLVISQVPEPSTAVMAVLAIVSLAGLGLRRRG